MPTFYVLTENLGHRFSHTLISTDIEGARGEQEAYADLSDNQSAGLTTDRSIAQKWENSCVEEVHKKRLLA